MITTLLRYRKVIQPGFIVILMVVSVTFAFGQAKQMVLVKTFDQKLSPFKNLELTLNGTIAVKTSERGTNFLEISETELPVRTIEIKNDELEVASWNFSKGILEIIVRKKNYQLVTVLILDEKQQPLDKTDISFTGTRKLNVKTSADGKIQLPLAPDERLTSPAQFSIKGYQSVRINPAAGSYTLNVERIQLPAETPKQVAPATTRSYAKEVASLDTVQSLSVFYTIVRDMAMDALNDDQKRRVDLKFNELLRNMQEAGSENSPQDPLISITDSTEVTDDIKRLMERALAERQQLDVQRSEFDTRINALDKKLSGGIADMDKATRDRLLSDIISLENLLGENQRQFDKNQAEYQKVINSLKERYFDIKILEEKLTVVEQLREQEQAEFRRQIIYASIAFTIFIVLIILLLRFSNKMRKQKQALTVANNQILKINENLEERVTNRTKLLQEAVVELDTFLYRASHDLRTPVASIEGVTNLAEHISTTELVDMVKGSTERMNRLLKNLSVISEINQPGERSEVTLADVVKGVSHRFEETFKKFDIQIECSCPESIRIHTYPVLLEVIVQKLVENSVFFTLLHEGVKPKISLRATQTGSTITVVVEDNGVGIDAAVLPRVFEMFFKGNEKSKGSGLGLYIVSRCLRVMRGSARIASTPGSTRVEVTLPESLR